MNIEIEPKRAQKKYKQIAKDVIGAFAAKHQINPDISISIHFVGAAKIKNLNRKYRHTDRATDVLSFPIWKNSREIPKKGEVNLGDIFICKEELQENLDDILKHGLNHLVGKHH